MPLPKTTQPPSRIQIQTVDPIVDCGRFAVKRTVGEIVEVYATVLKDGHDTLAGVVRVRRPDEAGWREEPLRAFGNDRFGASFAVDRPGRWEFAVTAWTDRIATWQEEIRRKVAAGQTDLSGELSEGAVLLGRDTLTVEEGLAAVSRDRHDEAISAALAVDVDRELARFGAWYELFPRSWGGFRGVADVLPQLAKLGFDVVYLPPIHPIGSTNRKGRNNALVPEEGDVGSPWAIGSELGGHDAIHPDLGTEEDFGAMIAAARAAGVEIALDFAIQCSPDHPWLSEHPEWFYRRPDGTLKYAENPPKRY
ncbi:MAG: maltotransferase domain-containing protein, partial [Gaiellaceae bacterium]